MTLPEGRTSLPLQFQDLDGFPDLVVDRGRWMADLGRDFEQLLKQRVCDVLQNKHTDLKIK